MSNPAASLPGAVRAQDDAVAPGTGPNITIYIYAGQLGAVASRTLPRRFAADLGCNEKALP